MTEYDWPALRALATRLYGDTPSRELEQRIIDVFEHHPQIVAKAIDHIAERYAAGVVRSPWPVLAKHVEQAAAPVAAIRATDSTDRQQAERNAEQWIRAAGLHFDRWPEVHDELFGDQGRLRHWRTDHTLEKRMEQLWREARPAGEKVEADELERAAAWKANREKLHEIRRAHRELTPPEGAAA